jgi:polar amino acid transport system substrate-binding protein
MTTRKPRLRSVRLPAALLFVLTLASLLAVWTPSNAGPLKSGAKTSMDAGALVDAGSDAAAPQLPATGTPLKIYTKPIEPFAYESEGKAVGFSIDLWDRLAKEAGITYELHWVKTVDEVIDAVKKKEADGGIAAISITAEREKVVDFSQPFYESGLGILVNASGQSSTAAMIKSFFSADFLKLCAVLLVLLVITAHLLWLFERKRNPEQFPASYFSGVWESAWWAISTILSGGCDNKGPIVIGGRIVGAFWMLTSIVLVAYFTASATAIMTVSQLSSDINGPADLPGKKVATVKGSTTERYLKAQRVVVRGYGTIDEAYVALSKKEVAAVVFDAPILLYHANTDTSAQHKVVGRLFQKQSYGIALQQNSPHRKAINEALLKLRETGYLDELNTRWFGNQE